MKEEDEGREEKQRRKQRRRDLRRKQGEKEREKEEGEREREKKEREREEEMKKNVVWKDIKGDNKGKRKIVEKLIGGALGKKVRIERIRKRKEEGGRTIMIVKMQKEKDKEE